MKVKLDENLGARGADLLRASGWDVATVVSQDLCSASDETLANTCRTEDRVLVSLDLDFANTLRFEPRQHRGLVVLRLPEPLRPEIMEDALKRVMALATSRTPVGKLWVVDEHRIREFIDSELP